MKKYLYNALKKFNITKLKSNYPNRKAGRGIKGMHNKNNGRQRISERMSGGNNPSWKGEDITNSGGRLRSIGYINQMYVGDAVKPKVWKDIIMIVTLRITMPKIYFSYALVVIMRSITVMLKRYFLMKLLSITHVGKEDTYDIEMVNNPHNFVANGLVVHNSQESQRYCNYNKDKFDNGITFC